MVSLQIGRFHFVTISLAPIARIVSILYNGVMVRLTLAFLGTFQVTLDSQPVTRFRSNKNAGLLVYLALQSDRPFPREVLATLFWPEESDNDARNNLRQAVYQLRKVLGDLENLDDPFLMVTRQTIQFNADSDFTLDVTHFWQSIDKGDLEAAVAVYYGDLLPGFTCDSLLFEEWLRYERERLHQAALEAMSEVTQSHLQAGKPDKAQAVARQQLHLEPWRESACRQLMQAYALAGDRSNALAQYEQCREVLWDELGVEPSTETVALYECIKAGDYSPISADESIVAPSEVRHNLPHQITGLIGREAEVASIKETLAEPETRLLTLTGPGGVGKTRLSLQVAGQSLGRYRDGVFFVALAQVREAAFVASAIMQALSLQAAGSRSPVEQLKSYLEDSEMLLVLDNYEHVLEARTVVSELLQAVPSLKVLATSRSSLNVYGEKTFNVAPLALPRTDGHHPVKSLVEAPAMRLFLERARAANSSFVVDDQAAITVAQICTRLDGLPLAIELAAVRVRILTPGEILNRLDEGIRFLRSGAQDVPSRHQTLMAAIQWSTDLLSPEDEALFRRMAVFVGGCTLEAAEKVCAFGNDIELDKSDVLDGLDRLVDHSLIVRSAEAGMTRFFMLETIHEYARERLKEDGEEEEIRRHHAAHFLALAQEADPQLIGSDQVYWLDRLAQEHGNLRVTLEWHIQTDPKGALTIASALRRFWHYKGYHKEGLDWFSRAFARHAELDLEQDAVLARAFNECGNMAWYYGEYLEAYELEEKSVSLCHALGDRRGLAYALWQLGKATWTAQGDWRKAQALIQKCIDILEDLQDRSGLSFAHTWMGFITVSGGSLDLARTSFEKGIALAAEIDNKIVLAAATSGLGRVGLASGDYAPAAKHFEDSLVLFREVGDLLGPQIVQGVLGDLLCITGNYRQSETSYREHMELCRVIYGKESFESFWALSIVLSHQGQFSEALRSLEDGLEVFEENGGPEEFWYYLIAKARLETAIGKLVLASRLIGFADRTAEDGQAERETQIQGKVFRVERERLKSELKDRLGDGRFATEWERGRKSGEEELEMSR